MNRKRKTSPASAGPNRTSPQPGGDTSNRSGGDAPKPPRPNKLFLTVAAILLIAWIIFLIVLAFVSGTIRA